MSVSFLPIQGRASFCQMTARRVQNKRSELIINADDFGFSLQRDAGILTSFTHGLLTHATLLVNGPTAIPAAKAAKLCGLPIGLHLNLTEGYPLCNPNDIASLIDDKTGVFLGKFAFREAMVRFPPSQFKFLSFFLFFLSCS